MFVCCECCVLSGRGLCDGLITRPEESSRLWCVVCVCDLETSWMRRPWPTGGGAVVPNKKTTKYRQTDRQLHSQRHTHNTRSTAVWNLKSERWGSPLVQEYRGENVCYKSQEQHNDNNNNNMCGNNSHDLPSVVSLLSNQLKYSIGK